MRTPSTLLSWTAVFFSTCLLTACTTTTPTGTADPPNGESPASIRHNPDTGTAGERPATPARQGPAAAPRMAAPPRALYVNFAPDPWFGFPSIAKNEQGNLLAHSTRLARYVTNEAEWSTLSPDLVAVSNEPGQKGRITGLAAGRAEIRVRMGEDSEVVPVLVTETSIQKLTVAEATVAPGRRTSLEASITLVDQTQVNVSDFVRWDAGPTDIVEPVYDGAITKAGGRGWGVGVTNAWFATPQRQWVRLGDIHVVAGAGDADRDGYFAEDDCNDQDASRSPGAPEIPGNGVDDNCNGQIDEACTSPIVCSRLLPPKNVQIASSGADSWSVTGNAEPGAIVVLRDAAITPPRLVNIQVDSTGKFTKSGLKSQLGILQVVKAGASSSAKIWTWVDDGNHDNATSPPVPKAVAFEPVDAQTSTVSGTTVLHAQVRVRNLSQPFRQYAHEIGSGFTPAFKATLPAAPGDWIELAAHYGNVAFAEKTAVRVPGTDTRPPGKPTIEFADDPVGGPGFARVSGQAEGYATVTVLDTRTGDRKVLTASAEGRYDAGSFPAGDMLLVWANDGTADGPKALAQVHGWDTTPPSMASDLQATGVTNGTTTITGHVEIGSYVTIVLGAEAQTVESTWSEMDLQASFRITLPATAGDLARITVADRTGNASAPAELWIPAAGPTPPAPRGAFVFNNEDYVFEFKGTTQPNTTLHVYNASARMAIIQIMVGDTGRVFWPFGAQIQAGDVVLFWAETNGVTSERAAVTATLGAANWRAPLVPLDVVASSSIDGVAVISGYSEIGGSVELSVGTGPVGSTADVFWSPASTDTLGIFDAAIYAEPGALIRVTPVDAQGLRGEPAWVTIPPAGAPRIRPADIAHHLVPIEGRSPANLAPRR
ncbi:MopE-related protein [Pendulispora albinea]|uniref:Uncharacterized protein n=1 Tax=Pendulispora albinea TaxID=2741071 RepID=A0ABZ2LW70_9BACT